VLRGGRSGDQIPFGTKISAPKQTGSGAQPTPFSMVTGSFQGLKRPGRGVDHPTSSRVEVKEKLGLYLYFALRTSRPVLWWNL